MLTVCKNDLSGKSHSGNQLTPSCFRPTRTNNFLQLERDTDPSDACFMQEIFTGRKFQYFKEDVLERETNILICFPFAFLIVHF